MPSWYWAIVATFALIISTAFVPYFGHSPIEKVKNGTHVLECRMQDGIKEINSSKVQSFDDGMWTFTNGHARNCQLVKVK